MARLETLAQDIQQMLRTGAKSPVVPDPRMFDGVLQKLAQPPEIRKAKLGVLRSSSVGHPCMRKTWYEYHKPETKEELLPSARIKFAYGDILEPMVLHLAELAGHDVTDKQKEIEIPLGADWKIVGHMDAKIDGVVVDAKSASSPSFKKFEAGLRPDDDGFGYLPQLSTYVHAEQGDRGAFLAVDKQLGTIALDVHFVGRTLRADYDRWNTLANVLDRTDAPPPRAFAPVPATHKRKKLTFQCSYCPFKAECWPGMKMDMEGSRPMFSVP